MPFKVTSFRLETLADILFILGLIAGIVCAVGGEIFAGILCLFSAFLLSYVLYAIAKILKNTETILERLNDPHFPHHPAEEETDHEEH